MRTADGHVGPAAIERMLVGREAMILVVAGVIWVAGCATEPSAVDESSASSRVAGAEEARRDIAAGRLELHAWGLATPQRSAFGRVLRERLGVHLREVAGCCVGGDELNQIQAYNRVMTAEIERRFGPGVVARLRDEAATAPPATGPAG